MAAQPSISLDPDGPLPLYHQIAVALRYRIATGEIRPGDRLPALRRAAEEWSVNYHTVRRAYEVLEEAGLVVMRRGAGSSVASGARGVATPAPAELSTFLDQIRDQARRRFGITGRELAAHLESREGSQGDSHPGSREVPRMAARREAAREPSLRPPRRDHRSSCVIVECNAHQCSDLAGQIRVRFDVAVSECLLGTGGEPPPGPPPPGPLIGTYFHLAEMRESWPDRWQEMYFPALHPDPALRRRIRRARGDGPVGPIPLCEREGTLARAMADDVSLLASDVEVVPSVDSDPATLLEDPSHGPVLVAPRLWDELPEELRSEPRLIEVRYVFREHDLDAIASSLGWKRRQTTPA